jgi:hypothetical protein
MGRYRVRTWLRGRLPEPLFRLFPKGQHDCGDHEWYRSTEDLDRCYHCEVGVKLHTGDLEGIDQGTGPLMEEYRRRKAQADPHALTR